MRLVKDLRCPRCRGRIIAEDHALCCLACGWERIGDVATLSADEVLRFAEQTAIQASAPLTRVRRWR